MKRAPLLLCGFLFAVVSAFGSDTASIVGTVTDAAGRVLHGAKVVALNVETGFANSTQTNADGSYSFPILPVGHYNIQIQASGFSEYQETGVVLDVNTALRVDAKLQVGSVTEHVDVSANAVQVDTESTHLGEVLGSATMESLPLNGRSYTDLLALQPGVVPVSFTNTSYTPTAPSGSLNDGTLSISGARGSSNGFMVNGGNVQEQMSNGTAIIPNLDSIGEFRIITNNFDAEYGHYSGGLVNVITKSGTNHFHGDAFEFLRNTDLDARNYYAPTRGGFKQNQFGGTFGGPIVREKLFFFADYQGTIQSIGATTGLIPVPSAADREGNLADESSQLTGTVIGPAVANTLSQNLGYPVSVGERFYTSGCTTATCVFPNAIIPKSVWSAPAANLLQYIPAPNVPASANFPTGAFTTAANNATLNDNKAGFRADANTRWGLLSGYYFIDRYSQVNPYASGRSTFGNFGGTEGGQAQFATVSDTKTFGSSSVNQFLLSYTRLAEQNGVPTGPAVDLASIGFTVGCNTLGICPQLPAFKTVIPIGFNNFAIGGPQDELDLWDNTYQVLDNYSKLLGNHNLKVGGIATYSQVTSKLGNSDSNGGFSFTGGAETGLDFADFLVGAPSQYAQGAFVPLYTRSWYYGLYAQDSWHAKRNLTLNYGLRWDVSTPWFEKFNHMQAAVPGVQSVVFPGAPLGWLFPGDPGIPKTISPVRYGNFAPRVGLAYSPDPKTSIRASWGLFYGDNEDWLNANNIGAPPFGFYWVSPTPPTFSTPFVDLYTGHVEGQRFPPQYGLNASPSHPDSSLDWAQFEPISSSPTNNIGNVTPYTESYLVSLQQALAKDTVLTMSYVGTQGHHLMVTVEQNPSIPSVCLSVSQPSQVAPGSNTCGPFAETGTFTTASGQVVEARQRFGPAFGSNGWYSTIGNSAYNGLQVSLRHTSARSSLLAGYTWSKSMDEDSSPSEQVYPFNPGLSRGLSAFDMTQDFVVSYTYKLPFDKAFRFGRLTQGWMLSGIARFATGFPVTILETDDRALIGATSLGDVGCEDEPNFTPAGKILGQTNPRKGGTYFDTSLFSSETLGQFGNSNRRFFHGPGINNWDMAFTKNLKLTESKSLEFRGEFFNIFNHTQFNAPNGQINSTDFGVVTSAGDPRIGQVAAKFVF